MEKDYLASFGARLKKYREFRGYTQDELATESGLTVGFISDLEQGRKKPSYETAIAIAVALDISMDQISFDKNTPRDEQVFGDMDMYRKQMSEKRRKMADHLGLRFYAEMAQMEDE